MDIKRIACFFTGGFTELNAMRRFMNRINNQVQYIQLCPTGTRKSKDDIRRRHVDNIEDKKNGLTGESLIKYILEVANNNWFKEEQYDAILIEDDKDDRFLRILKDGTSEIDIIAWEQHQDNVRGRIADVCPDIPVLFIYAAPEVEMWFWADWNNSFNKVYRDSFFTVRLREYVKKHILTERYQDALEAYGFFDNCYIKLSEQIQKAFDDDEFLKELPGKYMDKIPRYSKRIQGESMLDAIDPNVVIKSCRLFFGDGMVPRKILCKASSQSNIACPPGMVDHPPRISRTPGSQPRYARRRRE